MSQEQLQGVLCMKKPPEFTSFDVIGKLRGILHMRRLGHTGTLDPMATGVLPIFIGRATRGVEFFESAEKEYIAGIRLGTVTSTQDITGEVLETNPVSATREDVLAARQKCTGDIEQMPPMYSAIKIGGQKLYELARRGVDARIKPFAVRFVLRRTQKIHQRLFICAVGLIECLHVGNGQRVLCADDPKRGERHDLGFVQRAVNVENRQIFDSHRGSPVKSFLPV